MIQKAHEERLQCLAVRRCDTTEQRRAIIAAIKHATFQLGGMEYMCLQQQAKMGVFFVCDFDSPVPQRAPGLQGQVYVLLEDHGGVKAWRRASLVTLGFFLVTLLYDKSLLLRWLFFSHYL